MNNNSPVSMLELRLEMERKISDLQRKQERTSETTQLLAGTVELISQQYDRLCEEILQMHEDANGIDPERRRRLSGNAAAVLRIPPPVVDACTQATVTEQLSPAKAPVLLSEETTSDPGPQGSEALRAATATSMKPFLPKDEDHDADMDYFSFSESVWSASIFLGSPVLGKVGSCLVLFLLVVTMTMQLLFCGVVLSNFTEPEYDNLVVDGLRAWRRSVGHNLRYMDDLSELSLVSRVCGADFSSSLELSQTQASHVALIRTYLPAARRDEEVTRFEQLTSGPVLCLFVLTCYYATLIQEFQNVIRMLWAFAGLRAEQGRRIGLGSYRKRRLALVAVMGLFRAAICSMLAYAGTLFIVQTVDMRDLLMNAVALAFVIEVDELLYAAVAPVRVRNLINAAEPLPLRTATKRLSGRCTELMSVSAVVIIIAAVAIAWRTELSPLVDSMVKSEDAICGGRQNFVFAVDGWGTLAWTTTSTVGDGGASDSENSGASGSDAKRSGSGKKGSSRRLRSDVSYLSMAVEQIIDPSLDPVLSRQVEGVTMLRQRGSQSVADAADEGRCLGATLDLRMQGLLADLLQEGTVSSCAELQEFCQSPGILGVRTRQACPRFCGCSTVGGPLFWRDPELGCGSQCPNTQDWKDSAPADCSDVSRQKLAKKYPVFLQVMNDTSNARSEEEAQFRRFLVDAFERYGCGAVAKAHRNYSREICFDQNLRPVLLTVCPDTCGCVAAPGDGCPLSCFEGRYSKALEKIVKPVEDILPDDVKDGVGDVLKGDDTGGFTDSLNDLLKGSRRRRTEVAGNGTGDAANSTGDDAQDGGGGWLPELPGGVDVPGGLGGLLGGGRRRTTSKDPPAQNGTGAGTQAPSQAPPDNDDDGNGGFPDVPPDLGDLFSRRRRSPTPAPPPPTPKPPASTTSLPPSSSSLGALDPVTTLEFGTTFAEAPVGLGTMAPEENASGTFDDGGNGTDESDTTLFVEASTTELPLATSVAPASPTEQPATLPLATSAAPGNPKQPATLSTTTSSRTETSSSTTLTETTTTEARRRRTPSLPSIPDIPKPPKIPGFR